MPISFPDLFMCVSHQRNWLWQMLCNPVTPSPTNQSIPRIDILHLSRWDSSVRTDNLTFVVPATCASMAKSSHSSMSVEDIPREDNIVDYDSKTVAIESEDHKPETSASREPSRIAPNPFLKRSTAQALTAPCASTTLYEPSSPTRSMRNNSSSSITMRDLDFYLRH